MNTAVDEYTDNRTELAADTSKKPNVAKKWLRRLLIYPPIFYLAILGFLALNETYLVYPGSKYPKGDWTPSNFHFDEVEFASGDGTKLVGWHLRSPTPDQEPQATTSTTRTVLICHGNAENIAQSAKWNGNTFRNTLNAEVFEFDYRGYGKSEGAPFEAGILQDAEAALELVCQRTNKSPSEIILVGHSIGGGPAVHLAAKCGCKVLVLQRTFSSLADTAQLHYPWLPVRYFMRNQYPSSEKVKSYHGPLFQSHGDADTVIPIRLAQRLYEAAPSKQKKFFEVKGMTHWNPLPNHYWSELAAFVQEVEQKNID